MLKTRVVATVMSIGLIAAGILGSAATASAAAKRSVSLTFAHNRVLARQEISVTYSSRGLPKGSKLYLQRQFGSAHAWKTVKKLKGTAGTRTAPGVPTGKYTYRIQAWHSKKAVAASPAKKLYSYGTVSIATLCSNSNVVINSQNGCPDSGNTQIGGNVFQYKIFVSNNGSSVYPNFFNLIDFPATTCRSVTFKFGMPSSGSQSGDTAYLETIEQTLDPQTASVGFGSVRTFHAALDCHPWFLENAASSGGDPIAVNGTASCYTVSGY